MQYYRTKSFTPDRSLGYLVRRCGTLMGDLAERAFAERGVPFTQWLTLMKLSHEAPMTAGDLARALGHDQGALTRVLDTLVKAGMVERKRRSCDRRSVELNLTPEGRRYVDDQLPIAIDALNNALSVFNREEVDTMIDLLARLLARLTELKAEPPSAREERPS